MGTLNTMILIFSVGFVIYIFARCIYPLNISILARTSSFIGIFLLSNSLVIVRELSRLGLEFSLVEMRIFTFIFLAVIFFAVILILRDVLLLFFYALSKLLSTSFAFTKILSSKALILLALAGGLTISGYGTHSAIKVPDIKDVTITIPNLPESLKGFEIVQLTDLHIGSAFDRVWLEKVVAKTNAANADLIVECLFGYLSIQK